MSSDAIVKTTFLKNTWPIIPCASLIPRRSTRRYWSPDVQTFLCVVPNHVERTNVIRLSIPIGFEDKHNVVGKLRLPLYVLYIGCIKTLCSTRPASPLELGCFRIIAFGPHGLGVRGWCKCHQAVRPHSVSSVFTCLRSDQLPMSGRPANHQFRVWAWAWDAITSPCSARFRRVVRRYNPVRAPPIPQPELQQSVRARPSTGRVVRRRNPMLMFVIFIILERHTLGSK